MYSEQKNWFTKGQNLHVSQIMAQGTKTNVCEFFMTKVDILTFVTPKSRTLVPVVGLISIVNWAPYMNQLFCWDLVCALGPYHCLYPPGHALNQISTILLWCSLWFHLHLLPKLMHTNRRDPMFIELPLEVLPQMPNRVEVRWLCRQPSRHWWCSVWTILRPSEGCV